MNYHETEVISLFFSLFFITNTLSAQIIYSDTCRVEVTVKGPKGVVLKNPKVVIASYGDEIQPISVKGNDFSFVMPYRNEAFIHATADNYETVVDKFQPIRGKTIKRAITLRNREVKLKDVLVKGYTKQMVINGDTIKYNPTAVNILQGDMAKDILQQMPGVEMKGEDIKIMGENIEQTLVDGKKLFGDRPMTALEHVRGDDVENFKVYEKDSKKERRKKWILDIASKSKMVNSTDGAAIAAAGVTMGGDGHRLRHAAGGVFNFFSEEMILTANLMNNNENIASNQSLKFLSSSNANPNYSENSLSGFQFGRNWNGRKKGFTGVGFGYQFTRSDQENREWEEQNYSPSEAYDWRTYKRELTNNNADNRHQINLSSSYLLSPEQGLDISITQDFTNSHIGLSQSITDMTNEGSTSALLNNKNKGRGRETKVFASHYLLKRLWRWSNVLALNNSGQDSSTDRYYTTDNGQGLSSILQQAGITSDKSLYDHSFTTEFSYAPENNIFADLSLKYSFKRSQNDWEQMSVNTLTGTIDTLNTYHYQDNRVSHEPEAKVVFKIGAYGLLVKGKWNVTTLKDHRKDRSIRNDYTFNTPELLVSLAPNLGARGTKIRARYATRAVLPNITQLRFNTDNSNPFNITTGNPSLSPMRLHDFEASTNLRLDKYGKALEIRGNASIHKNDIVSRSHYYPNETYLPELGITTMANSQVNTFENRNGGWDAKGSLGFTLPLNKWKSNLSTSISDSYCRMPYSFNEQQDFTRTNTVNLSMNFNCNAIPKTRFSINSAANIASSSLELTKQKNHWQVYTTNINLRSDVAKNIFVEASYGWLLQHPSTGQTVSDHVLNVYTGILLKGKYELSLTAYDLLNAYSNYKITVEQNFIRQFEKTNYGRFVSLNFSWKFQKVKSMRFDIGRGVSW